MTTTPINTLRCGSCGYEFDACVGVEADETPSEGSVSLCVRCGGLDIFTLSDGRLGLRPPTAEEFNSLVSDPEVRHLMEERRAELQKALARDRS